MKPLPSLAILAASLFPAGLALADDAPGLKGQVVDSQNHPIAGATVYAWQLIRGVEAVGQVAPSSTAVSDENGNWSISGLNLKDNTVTWGAWKRGYTFGSARTVAPSPDGQPPQKITIDPVKPVRLHLVDWNNHPVKDASATFVDRGRVTDNGFTRTVVPWGVQIPDAVIQVKAEPDGTIIAPFGADKDLLTVQVRAGNLESVRVSMSVPYDDGLTVRLGPGAAIHGRLVDGGGQPIAGKILKLFSANDRVTTGADGSFTLTGLDDTPSYLKVDDPAHILLIKSIIPVRGTDTGIGDMTLMAGGLLSGTLTDAKTGKPVQGWTEVSSLDQAPDIEYPWESNFETGEDGKYSFRLPPGKFRVTFHDSRDPDAIIERTVTIADGIPTALDIAVPLGTKRAQQAEMPAAKPGAALPPAPDYIYGIVTGNDGKPVGGALVTVYQGDQAVRDTHTGENGRFAVGPLRGDMSPGGGNVGGLAAGTVDRPAPRIFVRAEAPGLTAASAVVAPGSEAPIALKLGAGQDLRLHLVDAEGKPVPGARVTVKKLTNYYYGPDGPKAIPSPKNETLPIPSTSGPDGMVSLAGLPSEGFCELSLEQPDFAPLNLTTALPRLKPVQAMLRKPAIVEGSVIFGDQNLKGQNFEVRVKANWLNSISLAGTVGTDGHFEVKNLPSSKQLNYDFVTISLAPIGDKAEVAPGLKLENITPGQNSNVYLTDTREPVTHRWIGYVDQLREILDGQSVHRDIVLHAMARVTGKVTPTKDNPDPAKMIVMYRDPNLENGVFYTDPVSVPVDKDGNFEVWIPAGKDVVLEVKPKGNIWEYAVMSRIVKSPAADEVREVTFTPEVKTPDPPYYSLPLFLRTVGPDGATVPRVRLNYKFDGVSNRGGSANESGMDGLVQGYPGIDPKGRTLEITSDYLDKPYVLKYDENQPVQTIPLSRVPETVPKSTVVHYSGRRESGKQAPTATPVGELTPELQVTQWGKGGPIQLAALRGKTVVVAFSPFGLQTLLPILERRPGKIVVIFLVNANGGDIATTYKQNLEGILGRLGSDVGKSVEAAISYVGQDLPIPNEWRGFNALSLGAGYGSTIIDPQGRIAATSLWGLQLAAKVDQLSE